MIKACLLSCCTTAMAVSIIPNAIAGQQNVDWDAIEVVTHQIGPGIYMLAGRGGNIGLSVGADGAFLIDDQFAPLTPKIVAAVAAVSSQPIRFLLNTHWHGDHTGGNENLGTAGALIVAHENVRRRMNPEDFRDLVGSSQQAPPEALPTITFTDGATFHWNGEEIRALHVEHAHTDGDVIVHFVNANVVHMGDTFFRGRYPFIDVNSGGNVNGMIRAAELILSRVNSNTKIIPGHGDVGTPADLRAFRDMLILVRDRVQEMVNNGWSEERVVTAAPTADLNAQWGANPNGFVQAVYRSLSN